ncbi:MAG: lipopolysaccharide biosynthesis protein [Rikenellaceae bacterium]|nr:lipopolysaccharide biosynthesis protein [Rikenellaceae bacterium]
MSDLKQSTKKALIWSALDKFGQQLFLMVSGILSMRLLDPSAFGLVAPLALYSGLAMILSEGGLSAALIRKTNASRVDYNTMFWYNFGLGILLYTVLFFAAPWVAAYNRMPQLTLIARVQFLGILILSFGQIQYANLIRHSRFKQLGIANVTAVMVSSLTVVGLALLGFGVWALVAQYLLHAFTQTVMRWVLSGFIPGWMFSGKSFRELFGFSSRIIVGSVANNISNNLYASVLGSHMPTYRLGLYNQANKVKNTSVDVITHIFGNSLYLMLSQLQEDPLRFRQAFRKSLRTVSFLLFPAFLGLMAVAPSLVWVTIGQEWMPAVPYIRILCFSGICYSLSYIYGYAFKARGRTDITLAFDIVSALLLVCFLLVTIRHGLIAALWADVACRLIVLIGYGTAVVGTFGFRLREQLWDAAPYALLAVAMAAGVMTLPCLIASSWWLLPTQIAAGSFFYLGMSKLLGSQILEEIVETFRKKKKKRASEPPLSEGTQT